MSKALDFFHSDLRMENTVSCRVVGLQRSTSRRLWMAHFDKSSANGNSLLGIKEETAGFGFRSRGSYSSDGFAENMNRAIEPGIRRRTGGAGKIGEEKLASSTTASIGKNEVSSVRADSKYHVTGVIADGSIGMGREIIKEHVACLFGVLGRGGLTVGNFSESNNDSGVTTARII